MSNVSIFYCGTEYQVSCISSEVALKGFINREATQAFFSEGLEYDSWKNGFHCACWVDKDYKYEGKLIRNNEVKLPKCKGSKSIEKLNNIDVYLRDNSIVVESAYGINETNIEAFRAALSAGCYVLNIVERKPREHFGKRDVEIPADIDFNEVEFNKELNAILNAAVEEAKNKFYVKYGIIK